MQLGLDSLSTHLTKGLKPIYLISGDEPLLVQEAADAVRAAARQAGCDERNVWEVGTYFDWDGWFNASQNGSLFASRILRELRFAKAKVGDDGGSVLKEYAERADGSFDVLLLTMPKVDAQTQKLSWFKKLSDAGVHVAVWPLSLSQLPSWIRARLKRLGMTAGDDAIAALIERVEGNLLACSQEIDKLHLVNGAGRIEVDDVVSSVADSARFDVFELVDLVLAGQNGKVVRVVNRLQEEGVEAVLLLWALAKEARQMAQLSTEIGRGESRQLWQRFRIWEKRQPLVRQALRRFGTAHWRAMLAKAAAVDRVIKGAAAGNPWEELLELALAMGGAPAIAAVSDLPAERRIL